MTWITKEQLLSFVQWIVTTGCGYALGKGWIGADDGVVIGSITAGVATLVWQVWQRTHQNLISSAASLADVEHIVMSPVSKVARDNEKLVTPAEYSAIQVAAGAAESGNAIF